MYLKKVFVTMKYSTSNAFNQPKQGEQIISLYCLLYQEKTLQADCICTTVEPKLS